MPLIRPLLRPTSVRNTAARICLREPRRPTIRSASTAAAPPVTFRLRRALVTSILLGGAGFAYITATDTRSSVHRYLVPTALRAIFSGDDVHRPGPEAAHVFGLYALRCLHVLRIPLHERGHPTYLHNLSTTLFGYDLNTPLGVSAGLDKHGDAVDALYALSPAVSIIEIGCVTPRPQAGNDKPRLFRLPSSNSMINRYGFNSVGAPRVAARLRNRVRRYALHHGLTEEEVLNDPTLPASLNPGRILAVQIGKNKSTPEDDIDAVKRDYIECVHHLGKYADVLVVNVSSPNTPGLRSLQAKKPLTDLLSAVTTAAASVERARKPVVVVKVSPDSDSADEISQICAAVKESGVKGVIVSNTTVRRPADTLGPLATEAEKRIVSEAGGLSGPMLFPRMLRLVEEFRSRLGAASGVDIIASGGVQDGRDAEMAMGRGAKAVLAYTGVVYGGVGWFGRAAEEMSRLRSGGSL